MLRSGEGEQKRAVAAAVAKRERTDTNLMPKHSKITLCVSASVLFYTLASRILHDHLFPLFYMRGADTRWRVRRAEFPLCQGESEGRWSVWALARSPREIALEIILVCLWWKMVSVWLCAAADSIAPRAHSRHFFIIAAKSLFNYRDMAAGRQADLMPAVVQQ